jgi:cytochrome b pre-mRNA-processing protein 3
MISRFRHRRNSNTISALYGTIVAQARLPCFYLDYEVPDTINGRFDLIVLHLVLMLGRMRQSPALKTLGQALFDWFCEDMDSNLREMGVSDLKVPKEMRRVGEAFYGRAQIYEAALRAPDNSALEEAIIRNIYGGMPSSAARHLAAYMRRVTLELQVQADATITQGRPVWPDPN